jgi:hypothetical protein
MKKFKKVLGYLILSQLAVLIVFILSISAVIKYGWLIVLLGDEIVVLIAVLILLIGIKVIDWVMED